MESFKTADCSSQILGQARGNVPIAQKVIPLHKDKKPTIILNDFVEPIDLFAGEGLGPSFGCFKPPADVKLRYTKKHSFLETIMLSYMHHLPLCLSPDDVWTVIVQGFGMHMEKNAEALRKKFVDFEGKKELTVIRNDGFLLNPKSDWEGCFAEYSEQIKKNIGAKNHFNLVPKFSTTGRLEQAVFDTSLMKSMDKYFVYNMCGGCGIPQVKMLGTLDDWQSLRKKLEGLSQYDLKEWVDNLLPIIDQFIKTYQGEPDLEFWDICVKAYPQQGSGDFFLDQNYGSVNGLSGWVLNFFPYNSIGSQTFSSYSTIKSVHDSQSKNKYAQYKQFFNGKHIPEKFAEVPYNYTELSDPEEYVFKMSILTGFCGMSVDAHGFIRPQIGWSIHCIDPENSPQTSHKRQYQAQRYRLVVPPMPDMSKNIRGIVSLDADNIIRLSKHFSIDISHIINQTISAKRFSRDATETNQDALREAFYKHELFDNEYNCKATWDEVKPVGKKLEQHLKVRMVKFMGRRVIDYILSGKEGSFTREEQELAVRAKLGEVESSKQLVDLYNKATRPVLEIVMQDGHQQSRVLVNEASGDDREKHIYNLFKPTHPKPVSSQSNASKQAHSKNSNPKISARSKDIKKDSKVAPKRK